MCSGSSALPNEVDTYRQLLAVRLFVAPGQLRVGQLLRPLPVCPPVLRELGGIVVADTCIDLRRLRPQRRTSRERHEDGGEGDSTGVVINTRTVRLLMEDTPPVAAC